MVQCRRHNTQKFRTELKPAPVKKILLDWFFYLSYPLNPRHFYPVNSNLGFLHLLFSYKVKIGHPYNSHEVIEYPKMFYFKPFLYLLLYLSQQYY